MGDQSRLDLQRVEVVMETATWWEIVLGGVAAALVILWFQPLIKAYANLANL